MARAGLWLRCRRQRYAPLMDSSIEPIDCLLERSSTLSDYLAVAFQLPPFEDLTRFRTSTVAGSLALEHGAGVRALLALQLGVPAAVVLRAQYEATLRSVWVCYCAKDDEVSLLSGELSSKADHRAKRLPQASEMLLALEGSGPSAPAQALRNFRTHSWAALNSFAHAGLHSLNRHEKGLPWPVIEGALRSSNGLSVIAAMQCAVSSGSQALVREVGKAQSEFADCLPAPLDVVTSAD